MTGLQASNEQWPRPRNDPIRTLPRIRDMFSDIFRDPEAGYQSQDPGPFQVVQDPQRGWEYPTHLIRVSHRTLSSDDSPHGRLEQGYELSEDPNDLQSIDSEGSSRGPTIFTPSVSQDCSRSSSRASETPAGAANRPLRGERGRSPSSTTARTTRGKNDAHNDRQRSRRLEGGGWFEREEKAWRDIMGLVEEDASCPFFDFKRRLGKQNKCLNKKGNSKNPDTVNAGKPIRRFWTEATLHSLNMALLVEVKQLVAREGAGETNVDWRKPIMEMFQAGAPDDPDHYPELPEEFEGDTRDEPPRKWAKLSDSSSAACRSSSRR